MAGYPYLTYDDRREIERLHNAGVRTAEIAEKIGKSNTAIYNDLKRGYTEERCADMRRKYSAAQAQIKYQDSIARRGTRHVKSNNKQR